MNMPEVVGKCPVCQSDLEVTELQCPSCHSRLSGRFDLCKFCKLTPEQKSFAETFIKNKGNIRDMERELGISYPTVRGRLEALIRALGYAVDSEPTPSEAERISAKKTVLDKLSKGEMTAQEAARTLRNLSSR